MSPRPPQKRPATDLAPPTARQLFGALLLVDGLLVAAYLLRLPFHDTWLGHARLFDLNEESSFGTWVSSTQFLLIATFIGSVALSEGIVGEATGPWVWAFAALFVGLSVDETAQVHEAIGHLTDALLPHHDRASSLVHHTGLWMFLLGPPVIAVLAWFAWRLRDVFARAPGASRAFGFGTAVWLFGALGLEALSNLTEYLPVWNVLEVAAEEGCELVGVSMMARATFGLATAWRAVAPVVQPATESTRVGRLDLSLLETAPEPFPPRRPLPTSRPRDRLDLTG